MTSHLAVRTITQDQHREFVERQAAVSFLQTPAWALVKKEWRAESVGWFADETLVGAALVLYRKLPKIARYLAYLPEGPTIDWFADDLAAWLTPLRDHLARQRAFGIRMGPPVVAKRWDAATIKAAIADEALTTLAVVPSDVVDPRATQVAEQLTALGWTEIPTEGGFSAGQPKYNFWLPLAGRTDDDLLAGMNQLWRRNIKKAAKLGVGVSVGDRSDLPAFHALYAETAERDHFTPRPLAYFETMHDALVADDPSRFRLYLAHHEGDLVAATTLVTVGQHAWYSYGASSSAKREVRGSNAIQWQMIRDARAAGAHVYDMRGITDTLDPSDAHVGLIQFKVGTGGQAVEYLGEWDLPLSRVLYRGFTTYMKRR